jgi:hypothetical protein
VKHPSFPGTREYVFELRLGINSVLTLSAGELSTLVLDGLFTLEEQDLLFPGVTQPEDRLRRASMEPSGYGRSAHAAPISGKYARWMASLRPATGRRRELKYRLDDAVEALSSAMVRQRMLMAKMTSLSDKCFDSPALTDADRESAEVHLAAAEAITEAVEAATKSVL